MRTSFVMLALAALGVVACNKGSRDRAVSTVTYSATQPRPDRTPASTRTVDSAGWTDNAGRTSEQNGRSEMSGMRATEAGSEKPTGTPGSGTPIPLGPQWEPVAPGEQVGEREAAGPLGNDDGSGTGAPGETIVGRVARARCDREQYCDRVGEGKPFGTGEQCTNVLRERARAEVVHAQCERGFETSQVALCLNAIRQAPCDVRLDSMDSLPSCQSKELCVP